jgi:H+/Cl- antiporter ClcA
MNQTGKILIVAGIVLVVAGLILYFAGDKLNWLGRLPGDIRIEKGNTRFYFPVTTMIVLSALLSFILWVIRRFF